MLYTIIYTSYPNKKLTGDDLNSILKASRENNTELDITGVLVFSSSTFIQVLEGDRDTVKELYQKIELDQRHKGAFIIFEGKLTARAFSDWSMGFKSMGKVELMEFKNKLNLNDPKLLNNIPALSLLKAFHGLL